MLSTLQCCGRVAGGSRVTRWATCSCGCPSWARRVLAWLDAEGALELL